jgi:hypothetical protein
MVLQVELTESEQDAFILGHLDGPHTVAVVGVEAGVARARYHPMVLTLQTTSTYCKYKQSIPVI